MTNNILYISNIYKCITIIKRRLKSHSMNWKVNKITKS